MSHPNDEQNPWKSLAELLSNKMDVVALATAIEKKGIYTWDRFGRMKRATKGDANDLYSKARALDLLALVYKSNVDGQNAIDSGMGDEAMYRLEQFIEDYDGPLVRFGWPSDACPDFEAYKLDHPVPKTVLQAELPHEDGLLGTRERKSLYAIIRALAKKANMPTEPYTAAKIISDLTSDENGKCEVSRNCVADHLKLIQDQTDTR